MNKEPITIIGAGIVGICCALSLIERGVPVRLIDRAQPGQGTSYGNAGVISPWSIIPMALPGLWRKVPGLMLSPDRPLTVRPHFWPKMIPWGIKMLGKTSEASVRKTANAMEVLCGPSIDLFRHHLEGTGFEHLIVDSYYVHAFRDAKKADINGIDYQIRREKGCDLELISETELRQIEPNLSSDFKAAVLIKGQARALTPGKIADVLTEKARSRGVEILNFDVASIRQSDTGWEVKGDANSITSKRVVLAAGVWSKNLLDPLGVELPLVAERGYHMQFADSGIQLNNSIMDVEAKVVASSMQDGLRLAGAAEFARSESLPDDNRQKLLTSQLKYMFPDANIDKPSFWMGRRPSFPDSLPVIGDIDGLEGLYSAFGHSHFGLMMAPKTGELIADLITKNQADEELSAFSYKRFL